MNIESKPTLTKVEQSKLDEIFKHFKELGCCDYCCLRFTGPSDAKTYINYSITKNGAVDEAEDIETSRKMSKPNPCLACLGVLQAPFCDNAALKIIERIDEEGYESNTFNIAITLPISYQIRSQSLWYYIVEKYDQDFMYLFPFGSVTVSAKDIMKWLVSPMIEVKTGMRYEPKSDFIINVTIDYQDNLKECAGLFTLFPETFKPQYKKGLNNISRKAVEDKFNNHLCEDDFRQEYSVPPAIPDSCALLKGVTFTHNSLYVAGRYCKFSRQLPQTPWIVGTERKMESSVQEIITIPLEKLFKASVAKFSASGREDVDVRMLGRGRPFTVELINPKRTKISYEQLRSLEKEVNSVDDLQVSVRDLQIIPKTCLIDLKAGEEMKCKIYSALCAITKGFSECLQNLIHLFPLELDQMTPVRVLHRRPVASRKRIVHSLAVRPIDKESPVEGTDLIQVELKTQAGTYVKEFVHGDLGRTQPSLQSLCKAPFIDIIALDVTDIELDWPPPVLKPDLSIL